jgi:hypothetical protein
MNDDDVIAAVGIFLIGLALLIFVSVVAAFVWFVVAAIAEYYRREHLTKKAEESFDRIASEVGVDLPVDDVVQAMVGAGLDSPSSGVYDDYLDLLEGVLMGTGRRYE